MISLFALFLELLMLSFASALGYQGRPAIMSICFIAFFSIAYFFDLQRNYRFCVEKNALLFGYILRIALLFFDLYGRGIYHLPNSGADSEYFYRMGVIVANTMPNPIEYDGFIELTAYLVRLCGDSRLFIQFITTLFSIVTLHTASKIMRTLQLDDLSIKKAMYLLCLLPNFAILSSIYLRESTITMLISIGILYLVRWIKEGRLKNLAASVAFIIFSSYFHGGSIGILIGYIILLLMFDHNEQRLRLSTKNIILSLLMFIVLAYLYTRYSDVLFTKVMGVESAEDIANQSIAGGSSYAQYVGDSSTIPRMVLFTPIRILMFLYSPFVWQIRGLSDIIALCFDSLFYIITTVQLVKAFRFGNAKGRGILACLAIIAFATAFVFGWGVANVGTAIRHRDKVIVVWIVMFALEQNILNSPKRKMPAPDCGVQMK